MNHNHFAAASSSDEEEVKKVLGPPADSKKRLDNSNRDTGVILQKFNDLLVQPYLDQLSCADPTDSTKLTDITTMISHYRQQHLDLEVGIISILRDLQAYSQMQMTLLPLVSADNNPDPGEVGMQDYLDANGPLVSEYLTGATDVSNKAIHAKDNWKNAVDLVQKSIDECDKQVDSLKKTLKGLSEEEKRKTLYNVLSGIGVVTSFTTAAFLPGTGILSIIGASGSLGKLTVNEILRLGKEDEVVKNCRSSIQTAKNTIAKLTQSVPFMKTFQESLSSVASIWSDIAAATANLNSFYKILANSAGKALFKRVRPKLIEAWNTVSNAADKYILSITSR